MKKLFIVLPLILFAKLGQSGVAVGFSGLHNYMDDATVKLMCDNGFKIGRRDYTNGTNKSDLFDFAVKLNNCGVKLQVTTQPSFQNDHSCSTAYTTIYNTAYSETTALVSYTKNGIRLSSIIFDWEILNEIQLRSEITGQVPWNQQQANETNYQNSSCMASVEAAARGIADAVHDQATATGDPLRVILGEVGRDWGFLTHMANPTGSGGGGVEYDVVGFHAYPYNFHTYIGTDSWYGTGGIIQQLGAFSKPVTWNEGNCGDIYSQQGQLTYDDIQGSTTTNNCEAAIKKHYYPIVFSPANVTTMNLESVLFYEPWNEDGTDGRASKSFPESKFGLMYGINRPKWQQFKAVQAMIGSRLPSGF